MKDFDLKLERVVRRSQPHEGRIQALVSQGKFLFSAGIDGNVVIFDYENQQEIREIQMGGELANRPSCLVLNEACL